VTTLHAQDQDGYLDAIGIPPYTGTLPVESGFVKTANGVLHLEIPLGTFPQRGGHQFKAALVFDSNIWSSGALPVNIPAANDNTSVSLGGWRIVTSADRGSVDYVPVDGAICTRDGTPEWEYEQSFVWYAPEGTSHGFGFRTQSGLPTQCNDGSQYNHPNGSSFALDSSGFYMVSDSNFNITVRAPDGSLVYPTVEDTNGNYYTSTLFPDYFDHFGEGYYGGVFARGTVTDSLGRNLVTVSISGTVIYIDVLNSRGSTSRYTLTTQQIPLNASFPGGYIFSGHSITAIQSIQLPDNTSYSFKYDCDSGSGNAACGSPSGQYYYGELISMTLPTGAQINYTYSTLLYNGNYVEREITSRKTPDSATPWRYAMSWDPGTCPQVTNTWATQGCLQSFSVTKPNGDTDVYKMTLNGGAWSTTAQFYTGASTLLATINQSFNFSNLCIGNGINACTNNTAIFVTKSSQAKTLSGPSSVTQTTQYSWDSETWSVYNASLYGNLITKSEWNFGSSTSNLPDRSTSITYLNGPSYTNANILNHPLNVTITDKTGAIVAKTINSYDGSSLTPVTGVANHDDTNYSATNTVRGNLTQTQKLVAGSSYITKTMTYDSTGQMLTETDWSNSNPASYDYTDNFFTDQGDQSPPQSYTPSSATNAYVHTITQGSLVTTFGYYWGTGQKALSTDPNGQTTYFHFYDPLNRPTSTKLPNGGWTYEVYTGENQLDVGTGITGAALSISCNPTAGDCRHDQLLWDGLGRVTTKVLVSDPDGATTVNTTYDSNSRVHSVSNPHRNSSSPSDGVETYAYDGLDRVVSTTDTDGEIRQTAYGAAVGAAGGLATQQGSTATYGSGYPKLVVDEAGKAQQVWIDGFGRTIEVDEPSAVTPSVTLYSYDWNDNLTGVQSAGGTQQLCTAFNHITNANMSYGRCFNYDLISRDTLAANPESGTTNYYYTAASGSLCSGDPSAVCRRTDARGITTTYAYSDALNRLTSQSYSDSTPAVTYYYDQSSYNGLTITNGKNRRTGMSDGSGQTAWSYDQVGNLQVVRETIATLTNSIQYQYNGDSSVQWIQYPSGRKVTYQQGGAQRPLSAIDSVNIINYAQSASYAPPGQLQSLLLGQSGAFSGINLSQAFNTRLQPTSILASSTNGVALNLSYCFNINVNLSTNNCAVTPVVNDGNVSQVGNNQNDSRTQSFTYDLLNRVATANTKATSGSYAWGYQFGYDVLGNLWNASVTQGSAPSLNVGINVYNQITGYCYDFAGNLLQQGPCPQPPYQYSYDAENRLYSTAGVSYTYDGDGKRVKKSSGTLYWHGTSGDPLVETDANGNILNEYAFFRGKRIARRDSGGNVYYYFADHLGTSRVITNATGSICYDDDYYPFGGEVVPPYTNTCSQNYKFTGKERDSESNLDNFGARYNSSSMGRFMSPDPMGGHPEDPQTLNRYAYVRNNPLSLTDPTGLDFYLRCEDESGTCHNHLVGSYATNDDRSRGAFTNTVVTSDSIRSGQNSATVDQNGVEITTGGKRYQGQYFENPESVAVFSDHIEDHNPIDLTGSGNLQDFSFHIDDNCRSTCLASGTFQYNGTPDQTRNILDQRGAFRSIVDRTIPIWGKSIDEWQYHENTTQHRFGGGPSPHFSVPRDPRATVPTVGPFHVDKDAPGIQHLACAELGVGCQ
jgi:RHS repeat-associated protein